MDIDLERNYLRDMSRHADRTRRHSKSTGGELQLVAAVNRVGPPHEQAPA